MEVVITGGQGFLGQELCKCSRREPFAFLVRYLLKKGELMNSLGKMQKITRPLKSFFLSSSFLIIRTYLNNS